MSRPEQLDFSRRSLIGTGWRTADFLDKNSEMTTAARATLPIERWKDRAFYTGTLLSG
jgi:hypothetical protein